MTGGAPAFGSGGGTGAAGSAGSSPFGGGVGAGGSGLVASGGAGEVGVGGSGAVGVGAGGSGEGASAGGGEPGGSAGATGGAGSENGGSSGSGPSGSGGGSAMGTGGSGASPDGGEAHHPDLGVGDGSDVVLLGDSWMSNTLEVEGTGGGIAPALIQVAGKPYRNYAVQGVMLLMSDLFGPAIPTQYEAAKQANPNIKTVVMTGGGNDIIQNSTLETDCANAGAMCKMVLAQIADELNTMWTEMASDGVQDVVYIEYASDVGTLAPSLRGTVGAMSLPICTSGRIRCHDVDTTAAVMGQIAGDGIHPLAAANTRIAQQTYMLMQADGMRR